MGCARADPSSHSGSMFDRRGNSKVKTAASPIAPSVIVQASRGNSGLKLFTMATTRWAATMQVIARIVNQIIRRSSDFSCLNDRLTEFVISDSFC